MSDRRVVEALLLEPPPRHVPLIAKHPPVRLKPTLDVDVAWPEMFKPDRVVVPKPIEDTESCVAVDEPTTNPYESPAIGLTASRANGVDVPTPSFPVASTRSISVPPPNDPSLLIVNTALLSLLFVSSQILNAPSAPTLASFTYAMFPLNLDVPITWKAAIGRYVPIPTLPDVLSTYIDCDEVPTVNNPLPHGDDVPIAKEYANVDVAVVLVAVK